MANHNYTQPPPQQPMSQSAERAHSYDPRPHQPPFAPGHDPRFPPSVFPQHSFPPPQTSYQYSYSQPQPQSHLHGPPLVTNPPPIPRQTISAPSPQYPVQILPSRNAAENTAISPTNGALARRPLPTPGSAPKQPSSAFVRSPLPTPEPTPSPASPPPRNQPMSPPTPVTTSPNRRPLPHPSFRLPNSSEESFRSSSPIKSPPLPVLDSRPSSPSKFVPYWKRNLPSLNTGPITPVSPADTDPPPDAPPPGPLRAQGKSVSNGRPLPPSPSMPPDLSSLNLGSPGPVHTDPTIPKVSAISVPRGWPVQDDAPLRSPPRLPASLRSTSPVRAGSDDLSRQARAPSPQYGIRDLPPRSRASENKTTHYNDTSAVGRPSRSSTLPQPSAPPPINTRNPPESVKSHHRFSQSVNLRGTEPLAATRSTPISTPASPIGWPNGLPPLPRAPIAGKPFVVSHILNNHRESVDLDEAPPRSFHRSRSPSPVSPIRFAARPDMDPYDTPGHSPSPPPLPSRSKSNPSSPKRIENPPLPPPPPRHPAAPRPTYPPGARFHSQERQPTSRFMSPDRSDARQTPYERGRPFASSRSQAKNVFPSASDRKPPPPIHETARRGPSPQRPTQQLVSSPTQPFTSVMPKISLPGGPDDSDDDDNWGGPQINVSGPAVPQINVASPALPQINVPGSDSLPSSRHGHGHGPTINVPGSGGPERTGGPRGRTVQPANPMRRGAGLTCGGCGGPIVGRIVSAMGSRWHPGCFRCSVCDELLEYVSSYEHEGRPYCHLDYHENFAPRCYHCKTAIVDERFITLDDVELGKRKYHEQHFFCSECGDPFLTPTIGRPAHKGGGELKFTGDGEFEDDDVGFTVHNGYPYCEACHVRLRSPQCKKCKKSIRDGMQAIEAIGGKWHWECFVCTGCDKPFENPSFFLRGEKPFCESCFSIIIKSEM
ncbi:hypothetical protein OF83DRAFT_1115441 [Amylostereum chailletii]|nr:hypothetical protein OF83DRAFT_1115441 [Amylostereum chailletii]